MYKSRLLVFILIFAFGLLWEGLSRATPMVDFEINLDQIGFAVDNTPDGLGSSRCNIYRFPIRRLPESVTLISQPDGWTSRTLFKRSGVRWVFRTPRNIDNDSMIAPGESLLGFLLPFSAEYPRFLAYALVCYDFSAGQRNRTRGHLLMPFQAPQEPVPEPTSVLLLGSGLAIAGGFLGARRRKREKTRPPS